MSVDNLVGQSLGQYELKELLGAGGMGAVYRAFQSNLKREVAVKVLPSGLAQQSGYIERFNREAEIAASLEHPNIVPIYDYGTQHNISYVVMRLLGGGSLAQRLAPREDGTIKQPSVGEAVHFLRQLASALDYAHSHNVVHRDIKPGNVMFDNHGSAYLVDFGIAKLMDGSSNLTGTGMMVGTPSYMAPELWRGEQASAASDQYALAAMVYGMMTGKLPFEAPTPYSLMHKHMNEMPTPLQAVRTDVPASLTPVLERALAKEPRARFPTATAFAQAFEYASEGARGQPTGVFTTPVVHLAPRPHLITPRSTPALGASTYTPKTFMPRPPTLPPMPPPAARRQGGVLLWILIALIIALVIALIVLIVNPFGQPGGGGPTQSAFIASPTSVLTTAPPPTVNPIIVPSLEATVEPSATQQTPEIRAPTETANAAVTIVLGTQNALSLITPSTTPDLVETNQAATQAMIVLLEPSETPTALSTETPSATPSPSSTPAPTDTPEASATSAPLIVLLVSDTPTAVATATPAPTETPLPSPTPSPSPTEAPLIVILPTDTPASTSTPVPTETPAPTDTATATPSATLTETPIPSDTPPPTPTATETPAPTDTPTAIPTDTLMPTEPPTATIPPTAGMTPTVIPNSPLLVPAGSPITIYSAPDANGLTLGQITDSTPRLVVGANHNYEYFLIQLDTLLGWVVAKGAFGYTGNVGSVPIVADQPPFVDGSKIMLPVYAEPSGGTAEIGTADNQLLLITGLSENKDYFRVNFFGALGWVPVGGVSTGGNLSTVPVVPFGPPTLEIGTQGVALHSAPEDTLANVFQSVFSTSLPITGITSDRQFWRVTFNGQEAWVRTRVPGSSARGDLSTIPLLQPPATPTPVVTLTPAIPPTLTLIPIVVATKPLATATPASTGLTVSNYINVNIRGGDGLNYPVINRLLAGTQAEVIGVSSRGTGWYQVRLPDGSIGWVGNTVVRISGDASNLPKIDPPPVPSGAQSGGGSGSSGGGQAGNKNSGGSCGGFRGTSPLSVVHVGSGETFYWDPAPGASSYRIIATNQDGKARMILETTQTSQGADTSGWAGDTSITWFVQALKDGSVICSTAALSLPTTG